MLQTFKAFPVRAASFTASTFAGSVGTPRLPADVATEISNDFKFILNDGP